jgi:hypothetical protein
MLSFSAAPFTGLSSKLARIVALACAITFALSGTSGAAPETPATLKHSSAGTYELSAGLDGEIYPVFANYASLKSPKRRAWGTISVKVTNPSSEVLRNRIVVQIPGWSDPEIQSIELGPGESHTYLFAPTLLRRAYQNRELAAATATMTATDSAGQIADQETTSVRLRSVDDLYWGHDFEYAPFVASWVTPHDPAVEQLLSRAKEFMPGRRLPGYESENPTVQDRSTLLQAGAIYRALHEKGVSYVKSSMTLGGHEDFSERVRMPAESLTRSSANCIDGAVLYAAMFENLGMDPVIVLVPGHAFVGVRKAPKSSQYLYIETSLTGRTTFAQSLASAARSMAKFKPSEFIRIDVRKARVDGIYPMPGPEPGSRAPVLDASRTVGHPGT